MPGDLGQHRAGPEPADRHPQRPGDQGQHGATAETGRVREGQRRGDPVAGAESGGVGRPPRVDDQVAGTERDHLGRTGRARGELDVQGGVRGHRRGRGRVGPAGQYGQVVAEGVPAVGTAARRQPGDGLRGGGRARTAAGQRRAQLRGAQAGMQGHQRGTPPRRGGEQDQPTQAVLGPHRDPVATTDPERGQHRRCPAGQVGELTRRHRFVPLVEGVQRAVRFPGGAVQDEGVEGEGDHRVTP